MKVDYLVIGQGICGSFLSWNLLKEGKSVLVIDDCRQFSASRVASGVINPVTGRRVAKTWMIDELLPVVQQEYRSLGKELNVELIRQCNTLQFHPNIQMRDAFVERYTSDKEFLHIAADDEWKPYFNFVYGIGEIDPCLLVDLNTLLESWRKVLHEKHALLEETFDATHLIVSGSSVQYKDISAAKIIFCNGAAAFELPYFNLLPYAKNKGEALIAEIPGLPRTHIYKQGITMVPWKDNLFWVGSTYEWEFADLSPTEAFRKRAEAQLDFWLKLPYKIVDHIAAERPATLERRPFVGLHPVHSNIGILNGMGTKGCSLAPYFAKQLAEHLTQQKPIRPDADVQRFRRILSQLHS